jgi:hypothetical protein
VPVARLTRRRADAEESFVPASTIIVQFCDGSVAQGKRVVLGFSSGQTSPAYTDRDGRCVVEHSSVGRATIYVSGDDCGSFHAPGKAAVTIR